MDAHGHPPALPIFSVYLKESRVEIDAWCGLALGLSLGLFGPREINKALFEDVCFNHPADIIHKIISYLQLWNVLSKRECIEQAEGHTTH